jgi:hypothetical protein
MRRRTRRHLGPVGLAFGVVMLVVPVVILCLTGVVDHL